MQFDNRRLQIYIGQLLTQLDVSTLLVNTSKGYSGPAKSFCCSMAASFLVLGNPGQTQTRISKSHLRVC